MTPSASTPTIGTIDPRSVRILELVTAAIVGVILTVLAAVLAAHVSVAALAWAGGSITTGASCALVRQRWQRRR